MCDQYDPTEIRYFQGFKSYNDNLYALEFPDEWMKNHQEGTGPECFNCLEYASWRGVLIGYCPNCAEKYEGFSRGPGFYGKAVEYCVTDRPTENSAFNTYLDGAFLDEIGDIDLNPSHTLDAHRDYYKELHVNGGQFITNENYIGKNHIVVEGGNIRIELETNPDIQVGDTVEYVSNNQMGWAKYKVVVNYGKLDLKLIDSYYLQELLSY